MALIAQAGANASYPAADITVAAISMTASAVDLGGGTMVVSAVWTVISAPDGVNQNTLLSNPTSITTDFGPFPVIGNYVVSCAITNDVGETSETDYTFMPDSAVRVISVATTNSALKKPAYREKGVWGTVDAWFDEIDALRGIVTSFGEFQPYKTAWVSPVAGNPAADGTPGNPYNPTSAVANSYTSPIEQALDILSAVSPGNASEEMAPLTIHFLAGIYDAVDLIIQTKCPVKFIHHGHVVVGSGSATLNECTWLRQVLAKTYAWVSTGYQTFWIEPDVQEGGSFSLTGSIVLRDGSAGLHNDLVMRNAYFVNISLSGQTGVCSVQLDDCNMRTTGSIVIAVASSYVKARNSGFYGPITLASGWVDAERCAFYEDVTVGQALGKFIMCDFGLTGYSFVGVAGSARLDAHSLQTFRANGWDYVGGSANERNVLADSTLYEIAGGAASSLTNKVTATQFTNSSEVFSFSTGDEFSIRVEFDVTVAAGDEAELSLYICDITAIVASGTLLTSVSVDATCTVVGVFDVRANDSGETSFNASWFKKGPTVPATVVPDCDRAVAYSYGGPTNYFGWVLTPAGAGTWTAGSTAIFKKASILRRTAKYV